MLEQEQQYFFKRKRILQSDLLIFWFEVYTKINQVTLKKQAIQKQDKQYASKRTTRDLARRASSGDPESEPRLGGVACRATVSDPVPWRVLLWGAVMDGQWFFKLPWVWMGPINKLGTIQTHEGLQPSNQTQVLQTWFFKVTF